MVNPWLVHVQQFRDDHPNLSYKEVLIEAKKTYTPQSGGNKKRTSKQKGGSYVEKPIVRGNMNTIRASAADLVRKWEKQKGEGYVDTSGNYHTDIPLLRRRKQKGGNPLAIAKGVEAVADGVGKITIAADHAADRGFKKKILTGSYDRAADRNRRRQLKRDYQFARRMAKKYGGTLQQYLP